jgi:glucokinase
MSGPVRVLSGDVGGTNTRLAIVEIDDEQVHVVQEQRYASKSFVGLSEVVRSFLADVSDPPSHACFGIPCPIVEGRCVGTNLSWTIDQRVLSVEIGIADTALINDLHAVGEGVQRLHSEDLVTLQEGIATPHGVKAIIGAGTGLGQAFLTWSGDRYLVHDSEGGHASFSPRNGAEWRLRRALALKFGHVSRERVVSGPGLVNIYEYLAETGCELEQAHVRAEMERHDPAAVIGQHGVAGTDPLSWHALDMFVSAYGAQAGNLALTVMAKGGVYVAGGIAPQILPKMLDGTFMSAFLEKGRLTPVLSRIPVYVIVNSQVGLIGAACVAFRRARSTRHNQGFREPIASGN